MVSRLSRSEFTQSLQNKKIEVGPAQNDPALAGVNVARADLNGDGKVAGATETAALFKEIDRFDNNGDASSVNLTDAQGNATRAANVANALKARAVFDVADPRALGDAALRNALTGATLPVSRGAKGDGALAIQYALARLGHLKGKIDGDFGPGTEGAVKAFQQSASLPQTGKVDEPTLRALDAAVSTLDLRTPAEKSGNAKQFLSQAALALPKLGTITGAANFSNPVVQEQYGKFVAAYWETLKENRVEADCKTVALFFLDQFRAKAKAEQNISIPRPAGLPESPWIAATASNPQGFFSRFESLTQIRPGYDSAQKLARLDPSFSMLAGVNLRHADVDANMAARAVKVTAPWSAARDNHGDQTVPEIPVNSLKPGDLIIIDHTGDGRFDHMANVVKVDKDQNGQVKSLVIATGSYDDMKDADANTHPRGMFEVNQYAEEVTIDFDAAGKVARSKVTWSSEPSWLQDGRYSARTLLMEMKPNGVIASGNWKP
jgi:peptidoglycan hydrolase-like protein with peptidoglycan-binding domain